MPINRYQIRNVYSLADPELYKAADKDDPEALLEGVAMAGLVGVLRQLGDLAEFAAEIFHDLHEEVMATAARGHGLLARVQQLESEFPSIERAFLSQTRHSIFFPNSGIDWHPNRQTAHNLITTGDLPRFVMDSYEECRGPPRLFLLDKFDVGGAGACLKRYTDPSVYKVEASSFEIESAETQRDKKIRKTKKKGSRWKGGETQEVSQLSHVKLHQLFLEERVQNGAIEPARLVKLKKRPNKLPFDLESGESYMNKLLNSPEDKLVHEVPVCLSTLMLPTNTSNGSRLEIPEDSMVGSALGSAVQSSRAEKIVYGDPTDSLSRKVAERQTSEQPTSGLSLGAGIIPSTLEEEVDEKQIAVVEEIKTDGLQNGYLSDDVASETDNYMDALATMESQLETNAELRAKIDPSVDHGEYSDANIDQFQSQLSGSQSRGNSIASDDGNNLIRKGITTSLYSDTTSMSTENASPEIPQPFACTEIPFHPRVPPKQVSDAEKIMVTQYLDHNITNDTCIDASKVPNVSSAIDSALHVDQVTILEEGTSKEADSNEMSSNHNETLTSPRKIGEHQIYMEVTVDCTCKQPDFLPTADSPSSMSFAEIPEGEVDDRLDNDSSRPMIHLPIISDTTCRISENSLSEVNEIEHEEDNHSTGSVDSHCSLSHSVTLHADEQPFDTSLAECGIDNLDVKPSYTTFSDDVPVAEVAADNPDIYSKEQFKEIADDILHIPDLAEAIVPYSSEDETKSNNAKIELMTGAVSDVADVNRSGGNDLSALKDEAELEERAKESVKSEVKVGSNPVSVPDDLDINEGNDLSTLEDDVELEAREVDSINLEVEKRAAVLLLVDVDKNEDNCCSTLEEPDGSRSVISHLCNEQNSQESGEKEEVDQLLVISPDLDYVSCDTAPYDSSNNLLLDSILDTSLSTCDDLDDDVDSPSLNSKILQDQSHSFLAETDQNGLQEVILRDLSSPPGNIAPCDPSNVQLLDSASSSVVFTEANHDLESKSPNHGDHDKFEAAKSSPPEDNVNQPNDQLHVQSLASEGSQMLPQLDSLTHIDHEKHFDTHSEPYPVNNATQSIVQEEDLHPQPMNVVVATDESTHIQDVQSSTESDSVPVSGKLHTLELLQMNSQEVNLSAQVKHQSTPVFSGFGILPQLSPVKSEDIPPLPPLPPMQWRMRKPQNALLTPTDGGQHSDNPFPSIFPCKADEGPQVVVHPTLDEIRNPDTENRKSKHAYKDLRSDTGGFSQILLPEASLHTEDHDKSSVPSETKFAETLMSAGTEHSHSVPTSSGWEIFWPSSNPYSFQPVDNEVSNTIRPIKVQRPRSPLIDAVAAHDKSKLRKVSDRATPQIPKGEESDAILEQIRAKSFNLKPAVQTRPSIQGPKTNLRVAAILEKANAIRQAFAGSDDDDDDSDNWSDS
ncbi:protein SCAR4-like [Cynara cardunculus var. scolymus]|uniref:protein SCAR4-like n=1 Tax=Cynara cardunculus var. scolymus TaxID=59895 RepID=UPI000D62F5E2|nr:protein SCAR4-like [Cynara cardunculus var. scolymus]